MCNGDGTIFSLKLNPTLNSSPKWQEPKVLKFQRLCQKIGLEVIEK